MVQEKGCLRESTTIEKRETDTRDTRVPRYLCTRCSRQRDFCFPAKGWTLIAVPAGRNVRVYKKLFTHKVSPLTKFN